MTSRLLPASPAPELRRREAPVQGHCLQDNGINSMAFVSFPVTRTPQVNKTLPWALFIHLCFTCWFLGTESLESGTISDPTGHASAYRDTIHEYEQRYGILVRAG